jgi:ATP-dependent RNA helicase DeaD
MGLLPEVGKAIEEMGFLDPMPVQSAVFARMMRGRDVMVQARTGSGKTAAFGIPFAQGLVNPDEKKVQALVLAPTRELALQVAQECGRIAQYRGITCTPIYGGAPMGKQVDALKAGTQVVAGTPGRVLDHLRRGTLRLDGLKVLVLDEADEMLSMGFLEEITDIIKQCPVDRQTTLFSATIPDDIERIGSRYMRAPEKISLSADGIAAREIHHSYYMVSGMNRSRDLLRVLAVERPESAIIFCNTREETSYVAEFLKKHGLDAEAISSDLTQKDRERVMGRTKEKNLHYLVATDIAARGIDVSDLSHVINYTFPESAEVYVHRTGRTGRAGKSGTAVSLIAPRELGNFYMLKLTYKIKPEERQLPVEDSWKSVKEAERVDELKEMLGNRAPTEEWIAVARDCPASP